MQLFYAAGALIEALSDGLAELDALNVTCMALIVPIGTLSSQLCLSIDKVAQLGLMIILLNKHRKQIIVSTVS